jgi:Ca2+-binding RTX toxin-like protein
MRASFGRDLLNGGEGVDILQVDGDRDVSVGLFGAGYLHRSTGAGSTLLSIEGASTGGGDDSVVGSSADNLILVGNGNNVVYGLDGNDTIVGGSLGQETVNGGAGNDLIIGQNSIIDDVFGHDVLNGGAGDDTIASVGSGIMTGGPGDDHFLLTEGTASFGGVTRYATSVITDFERSDQIHLELDLGATSGVFVGEVADASELELFEIGYMNSGEDTLVLARLPKTTDLPGEIPEFDQAFRQITLTGFEDRLTLDNFDLG